MHAADLLEAQDLVHAASEADQDLACGAGQSDEVAKDEQAQLLLQLLA